MKTIYLIADLSQDEKKILNNLEAVLPYSEIYAIQIWNHNEQELHQNFIEKIKAICYKHEVPIILSEDWETAKALGFSGVHFNELPDNFNEIQDSLEDMIIGFTTGNDMQKIIKAEEIGVDYISFCSMFPSPTANSCEFVKFESVAESRKIFQGEIFLAGGITAENYPEIKNLPYDGIAIASGILGAENPGEALKEYLKLINS